MAAYLAAPLPLAVSQLAGSYLPNGPLDNLLNDRTGMVWRSASTTDYIVVTLNGATLDTIALWATNMAAADTVRVRFSANTAGTSPTFDQYFSGVKNNIILLPSTMGGTYLRLDFTRSSGIPYVEVAKLVLANKLVAEGVNAGAEQTYEDQSTNTRGPNWTTIDPYSVVKSWKVSIEGLTEDDFMLNWDPWLSSVGEKTAFVFIPYYPTTYLSQLATMGRMTSPPKVTWITQVDRKVEMTISGII